MVFLSENQNARPKRRFLSESASEEQTFDIGRRIAACLSGGAVVAITGCIGSGKTCLCKGIVLGLGIHENVTSPTYTIVNEYPGPVFHIDAYRLENGDDFIRLGGKELLESGVSLIEWADRIMDALPEDAIGIEMEISGPQSRRIYINGLEIGSEHSCG